MKRYLSLDVFRGLDLALMIIVNTPAFWNSDKIYAPLLHADWHGFTFTDLIFPTFLFVVGNSMSFGFQKFKEKPNAIFLKKIVKRTLILFTIGFLMYWFPFFEGGHLKPFENTRVFGVLQRIALCYFLASLMIRYLNTRYVWLLSGLVLLLYQLLFYLFGDYSLEGNTVLFFDKWLVGASHMYGGEGIPFDPEGFLSTFPAVINVIAGYYTGVFLQKKGATYELLAKFMMVGALLISVALLWNLNFPINKKLWTSSFVLLTIGIDLFVISVLVYIIEMQNRKKWTYFFKILGKNTLFIYLISGLLVPVLDIIILSGRSIHELFALELMNVLGNKFGNLLYSISFMMICWVIAKILDSKKMYIKV